MLSYIVRCLSLEYNKYRYKSIHTKLLLSYLAMMKTEMFCFVLFFITGYYGASIEQFKTYENYKVLEIDGDANTLNDLVKSMTEKYDIPFIIHYDSKVEILVAPEWIETLNTITFKEKLNQKIAVEDFSKIISKETKTRRGDNEFSWTAYYDVDDIYRYLETTNKAYPNWTQVIIGGESYEGRKIQGLRINTPLNANKPVVFIESGIHAREWITPATTTYFINQLLTSDNPDINALRDQFDWHIFPTVNPDGYHYTFTVDRMWRKTRSKSSATCYGADPNRNWDYDWLQYGASNNPCDYQTYAGSKPFSEIETRTLSNYIGSLQNLLAYVAFHSDAQMLLLPYSDSTTHVDNYDDLKTIGTTSLHRAFQVNGASYRGPATAAEILYKASGGSMDWVRSVLGTPLVYTYELRGTYFTWPANRIHEQGDEVTQMMLGLADEARNLGYY